MSLTWRKFNFFEKSADSAQKLDEGVTEISGSKTELYAITAQGEVVVYNESLEELMRHKAHLQAATHIHAIDAQKLVVTLGLDEGLNIKVWRIDVPSKSLTLLRTIDCLAGKHESAVITHLAVHYSSPQLVYALGLSNGHLLTLRADTGKDKVVRTELSGSSESHTDVPVTNLAISADGGDLLLYATTELQTIAYNLAQPQKAVVLDELGAPKGAACMSNDQNFVVARPEAVYLYTMDGRGPCFVFDGEKRHVAWAQSYFIMVSRKQMTSASAPTESLQLIDLKNKFIAQSIPLKQDLHGIHEAFGAVTVVDSEHRVFTLTEKPLAKRLEILFHKSLYLVALSVAESEKADSKLLVDIRRRYADHLYSKHDYDAAMTHYLFTIGSLEPSFVIRRFLDAQRIYNLTSYLEALHDEGIASVDHTTLLLNCFTKLKDVAKLDKFLKSDSKSGGQPSLRFDVETAIKVCRSAGYFEHARYVAHAANLPQVYLDILIEDCKAYEEALEYLDTLPRPERAAALQKYGKVLVNAKPEVTTAKLMPLCIPADTPDDFVAQISMFAHLYDERPQELMVLCEFILNSSPHLPAEEALYHTLIQLYLAEDPNQSKEADQNPASSLPISFRRQQALELLKRGWQPGQQAHYNADEILVLCRSEGFNEGLKFLYEKQRLFREVLQIFMAENDYPGLLQACLRLGDSSRGGDPQLWSEVLEYLTAKEGDVSKEIQEILSHIEEGDLLPPLVILQTLGKNPRLKLSLVKDYIARQLEGQSQHIREDLEQISKYEQETKAIREETQQLKTQARVFQNSKCAVTGAPLELPAVHFMCGHSCNLRNLGENERECPICAPQFRTILEIRRSLKAGAHEQDRFFNQLKSSADGFNVIAEFFGRGLLNNAARQDTS